MKLSALLLAVIVSSLSPIGYCQQQKAPSHDGRWGGKCNATVVPHAVCEVSFMHLIASPERYDGKIVAVVGYLAKDDKTLTLYPDENAYRTYDQPTSLEFFIPASQQTNIANKFGNSYVRLVGRLNAKSEGTHGRRLGVINELVSTQPISLRDAINKEEDQVFRLEDLNK